MSESEPKIARHKPWYYKVVPGKQYFWCACGRSASQPFCDGSHRGTGIEPLAWQAGENEHEVLFCGCKHSGRPPFCDGAHNNLQEHYASDDPDSATNRQVPQTRFRRHGRIELNGRCYVTAPEHQSERQAGMLRWCTLVSEATGARHQSQFSLTLTDGVSQWISCGDAHAVVLCVSGAGRIEVGLHAFDLAPLTGVSILPGESIRLTADQPLSILLSACPAIESPQFGDSGSAQFDEQYPNRSRRYDPQCKTAMGDRAYQVLVDQSLGSPQVTQFVGLIPTSKAAVHRHLYEECLAIIEGEGWLWTEDLKARVRAGDLIFLPARQSHSLQVTSPEGMTVAGVIYPGGNPDINY